MINATRIAWGGVGADGVSNRENRKRMNNTTNIDHSVEQPAVQDDLQDKIDDLESKQKQVEAALQGDGSYLGIRDRVSVAIYTWGNILNLKESELRLSPTKLQGCLYELVLLMGAFVTVGKCN